MTIRIIDCETSGFAASGGEIVEIASVDLTPDFGITNPLHTMVRPLQPIPAHASAVHHILDRDVSESPFLGEAVSMFRSPDLWLVAHNAAFDRSFLGIHIDAKGWVCTLKAAKRLWPDFRSHANQAIRYELGLVEPFGRPREEIAPHRALSDVIVTAAILARILETKQATFRQLVEWTEAPTHLPVIPVGKFKGQPWFNADDGWLEWALGAKFNDDVKAAARAELARRRG